MRSRIALACALLLACLAASASANGPIPAAKSPEEVGLSSAQLARLEAATKGHIEAGLVPGADMLIVRKGKIAWRRTLGFRDRAANDPLREDAIFRLYSMTKPIVSVAIMMLVEEGRMQVADPVANYLPEFKDLKVGIEKSDAAGARTLELAAPDRSMTIQDLLRHTSGLIYGTRGDSLINKAYLDAKIGERGASNEELVQRLAKLPLRFSPGTKWEYGVSTDVLGRVLEVVHKKPLGEVLEERVLKPLGMKDTAFVLGPDKLGRAAQPWQRPDGPPMTPRFDVGVKARYESGGGGLVGTMSDYLRFTLMLANGGALDGSRILGKQTLAFMTADHTGAGRPGRPPGLGFGLGFEVRTRTGDADIMGSPGEYGWAGNAGTLFWIDPKEELIAIYMVQVNDFDRIMLRNQFRSMVQAAIVN